LSDKFNSFFSDTSFAQVRNITDDNAGFHYENCGNDEERKPPFCIAVMSLFCHRCNAALCFVQMAMQGSTMIIVGTMKSENLLFPSQGGPIILSQASIIFFLRFGSKVYG